MFRRIFKEIETEIRIFKEMDVANSVLYHFRLILAVVYTGFIGLTFAAFAVMGSDATEQEAWGFLFASGCNAMVVFMIVFPPRIVMKNYFFVAGFVFLNIVVVVLPVMAGFFW